MDLQDYKLPEFKNRSPIQLLADEIFEYSPRTDYDYPLICGRIAYMGYDRAFAKWASIKQDKEVRNRFAVFISAT